MVSLQERSLGPWWLFREATGLRGYDPEGWHGVAGERLVSHTQLHVDQGSYLGSLALFAKWR